ncbi:MAG: hypothetical protein AAF989_10920 [Planctomycetota bacterium]
MNTPTHVLINWTVAKALSARFKRQESVGIDGQPDGSASAADDFAEGTGPAQAVGPMPTSAVLLGAIAPDLPLYFLSFGGAAWFHWGQGMSLADTGSWMFGNLFYNDPWWITLHNSLHSPLVSLVALGLLFWRYGSSGIRGSWWAWFFGSCLLHTMVDIPVHHDDGPLVFWPLNWQYRFASPLSYWDSNHHAGWMVPLEAVLALALGVRIVIQWWRNR